MCFKCNWQGEMLPLKIFTTFRSPELDVLFIPILNPLCKWILSQFPFPDARLLWLIHPTTYGLYIHTFLNVLLQQNIVFSFIRNVLQDNLFWPQPFPSDLFQKHTSLWQLMNFPCYFVCDSDLGKWWLTCETAPFFPLNQNLTCDCLFSVILPEFTWSKTNIVLFWYSEQF